MEKVKKIRKWNLLNDYFYTKRQSFKKNVNYSASIINSLYNIFWFTNFYIPWLQPSGNSLSNLCVPFSRIDRISDILVKACPLIIIGTGLMLCFKSNVWNIGAEGQFIMGALLAGFIALSFPNIETKFFLLITICWLCRGSIMGIYTSNFKN